MNLDFGGAAFRMFSVGLFVIKSSHNFVKKKIYIYRSLNWSSPQVHLQVVSPCVKIGVWSFISILNICNDMNSLLVFFF